MKNFICLKGITLSGEVYPPGKIIPHDAVLPERVGVLTKQGYIAPAEIPVQFVQAPIYTDESGEPRLVPLGAEEVLRVFTLLQLYEQHAVDAMADVEGVPMLDVIYHLEHREAVREAARARALLLDPETVESWGALEKPDETPSPAPEQPKAAAKATTAKSSKGTGGS